MLDIAALCLVVTALLTYLNHRLTRLPMAIGVMVIALGLSLVIVLLDAWGVSHALRRYEESFLRAIDFSDVLTQGMLSFLLFAGAPGAALLWSAAGLGAGTDLGRSARRHFGGAGVVAAGK